MIKGLKKKLLSDRGETIAEGIASTIVVALAALSLATMLLTSEQSIITGQKRGNTYYTEEAKIEDFIKGGKNVLDSDEKSSLIEGQLSLSGDNGSSGSVDVNVLKEESSGIWAYRSELRNICSEESVKVIFKDVTGAIVQSKAYIAGDTVTVPTAPSVTGYVFQRWVFSDDVSTEATAYAIQTRISLGTYSVITLTPVYTVSGS